MSYLTVVFKDIKPGSEECEKLIYHPNMGAASWGHSIDDANFWRNKVEQMPSEVTMNTYEKVDDDTVIIDGVEYKKVKEKSKPQTLLEIIRDWNDDEDDPPCEVLVDMIADWIPSEEEPFSPMDKFADGWNSYREKLIKNLK